MMADEASATQTEPTPLPGYVETPEQKRRWALCAALMENYFADLPEGERLEQVWQGTRALYFDPTIPTGGDETSA